MGLSSANHFALQSKACQGPTPRGPFRRSAQPPHHREPRPRPALAERDVLQVGPDLEPRRADLLDGPAVREHLPDLPLRDPPRSLRARFLVAEAEQEEPTARPGDMT